MMRASWFVLLVAAVHAVPNVLIWMPDDMKFYWDETPPEAPNQAAGTRDLELPNVDRVRNEGAVFTHGYTSSPICAPARFSVLTGRYGSRGATRASAQVTDDVRTVTVPSVSLSDDNVGENLQTILQANGYVTMHAGKWHLANGVGFDDSYSTQQAAVQATGFTTVEGLYIENMATTTSFSHNMEWVTEGALTFISDAVGNGNPFFLYFCPTVPHSPNVRSAMFDFAMTATPAGELAQAPVTGMPSREDVLSRMEPHFLNTESPPADSGLGALWADDSLGVLLDRLEALEVLNNTVVVALMDHGMLAKDELYEGGVRILYAIRYPPLFAPGKQVSRVVGTVDLAPTLLALAGIAPTYEMDGESFADDLESSSVVRFAQINYDRTCITQNFKAIATTDQAATSTSYPAIADAVQLYDLAADPTEQVNLASDAQYATVLEEMLGFLQCHFNATRDSNAAFEKCAVSASSTITGEPVLPSCGDGTAVIPLSVIASLGLHSYAEGVCVN